MSGPAVTRNLPVYEQFKLNRYHTVGIIALLGTSMTYNLLARKPRSSGMLRHGLALVGGYYGGEMASNYIEKRRRMRVLLLEDYINQHPEDFPAIEPRKYKDVLMPWVPRR